MRFPGKRKLPATERALATARIEAAMAHLAIAREQLDKACRDLSDVIGGNATWRVIRDLSERVKDEQHKLDETAARDHSWKVANLAAPAHGCGDRPERHRQRDAEVLRTVAECLRKEGM